MLVVIPIALTIWIVLSLIQLFSGPVSQLFGHKLSDYSSFALSIIFITLVGFFARNFLGQALINFFEAIILKIPLVRLIYKSIKQVANSYLLNKKHCLVF